MASERSARAHFRRILLVGCAFGALLSAARPARAAEPFVWYRAGEGCPDGPSFLERLERRGVRARLAKAGDPVDFVVTLGPNGEHSSGRLERQTSRGTIAIRQVEDAQCEALAEALALTLALTHDPLSDDARDLATPPEPAAPPSVPPPPPVAKDSRAPAVSSPPLPPPPLKHAERGATLALGVETSAWDLFQGSWLLALGPFAELEAPASFALPRATLRAVVRGGLRVDGGASARVWLAAGRIEGCPVALVEKRLELRPCAAIDAGGVGASAAGVADSAWWLAAAAHARFTLRFGTLALEGQAGMIAPVTRYEVLDAATLTTLEKTQAVGFAGGLGASVRID